MWGAVIGAGAGIAGGIAANKSAKKAAKKAAKVWDGLETPDIGDQRIYLEDMVQQGVYTPAEAEAILAQDSAMGGVEADQGLRDAQMGALQQLQEYGTEGMTATDKAQLSRIQSNQAANERGSREAILQDQSQRGMGGSGNELAAQLMNQQSSAGNRNLEELEIAAQSQQNRMAGMQSAGQMAGQMSAQDFNQQVMKAQAADAVNQFNTNARQSASNINMENRNNAQLTNLGERQRVSDANTAQRNMQQQYNKELVQKDFDNKFNVAANKSSAIAGQATQIAAANQNTQNMIGGIIQAGATAWGNRDNKQPATGGQGVSDRNAKTNIEEINPNDFLNSLTGYEYNYKDEDRFGEGEQVGIMAQDLEKVAPQAVLEDEDGTKMIDYNKLGAPILAALASLNQKVNALEEQ